MSSSITTARQRTGARRLGAAVGPALIGAFVLASCGGGESAATQSTIDLSASSTAFVVRPPATTEAPADSVATEGVVEGTQNYEVQAGDYPYKLVNDFGITLQDLIAVNEWASENEFPGPGTIILIPPGGKAVAAVVNADEGTATVATGDGEGNVETETVSIPDAGDNCGEGSYTIVEGDYEGKVAGNFDVTVDALRAVNATTSGYSAFYPGLEIVIPAKADC